MLFTRNLQFIVLDRTQKEKLGAHVGDRGFEI